MVVLKRSFLRSLGALKVQSGMKSRGAASDVEVGVGDGGRGR